ncbi:hypothetical protein K1719_014023 [Acacia pycnantha]|nr:hypothetical protein K1719_014023 [Acacia pycnantha]
MSKEEFLKIQKSVLKVNIHCDGCKHKVKKILQKIDGVFTTEIDAEQGKVTVSGNVDPNVLIKKLAKSGKHAQLWGAPKSNNNQNQNHLTNQVKNMQIDSGKGSGNNKGQKGVNNQPKGGGGGQHGGLTPQQLQQLQSLQDLKLPQFKLPPGHNPNQNQKSLKYDLPEDDDDYSDDELDDDFYDDDLDDDEFDDDEMNEPPIPLNKMKPAKGNGAPMMLNGMNMMNPPKGGNAGPGNGKKGGSGGGGAVPIQVHGMGGGNDGNNGNGGKKGGEGNNQSQGGGNKNNGGKNGNNGGGGGNNNKNGNIGGKKGGGGGKNEMMEGVQAMNKGPQHMGGDGNKSISMGNMPMGQMGGIPAVQGLPAASMNGGAGGYFPGGGGPDVMAGNPYNQQQQQQQQYLAALMNQQRAMGNERFQPMMYARPPPAVNYIYPPAPYPYPPQPDPYSSYFSDENPSSCSVM